MKIIPYGKQHITAGDIEAVVEALTSDFLTQGPRINQFENAFANYVGARYAVAVSNGTAALHLAALALQVNAGSRVITTPITFSASANCIRYCGGHVEFCDIDPKTQLLDLNKVEQMLASKPKGYYQGIIPVDFAGYPVDLEQCRKLADQHNLWIIEDACHAPGAYFCDSHGNQQLCGNGRFADLAIFSFHPVKHIATGEGGMITTNDEKLYERLILLRTHGITKEPALLHENHGGWYYEMQDLGYNYRLTDFQAALGSSQLKRADEGLARRKEIARIYTEAFEALAIQVPQVNQRISHAYHLYPIQADRRKELYAYLHEHGIRAQVHYIPVHTMPYYLSLGWKKGDFPVAEAYYEKCLSLPMYPTLAAEDQDYIIRKVKSFIENNS
jgi:UDP-4-amino-4,6-dideoxy-N-acetyl-beta-L-altrosamine transaminase